MSSKLSDLSSATPTSSDLIYLVNSGNSRKATAAQLLSVNLYSPGGRLTLTSGKPILAVDTVAQGTIYYTPYIHQIIPINGALSAFSEISVALDATNAVSGSVYDLFVASDSGTIRLGYGPAWSTLSSRGTGAGTTQISMSGAIWANTNTITLRYDSTHTFSAAAGAATYVGSFYATANGQTGMAFDPTPVNNGTAPILGLYNAYNRVKVSARNTDNTATWTYTSNVYRPTNSSVSNRCSWVDGLQQSFVSGGVQQRASNASASSAHTGVNLDSTSGTPANNYFAVNNATAAMSNQLAVHFLPQLGFHFLQMMEADNANTGTTTFGGGGASYLMITLEM